MERIISDNELYCIESYELMRKQYIEIFEKKLDFLIGEINAIKISKFRNEFNRKLGWITEEELNKIKQDYDNEIKVIEISIKSITNKIQNLKDLEL